MQYVIDHKDFIKGLALSRQTGGFWDDMRGIEIYGKGNWASSIGILKPGFELTELSLGDNPTLITKWAKYAGSSYQYNFGVGGSKAYRIKNPGLSVTALDTEQDADHGIERCVINGADYIYVATALKLGRIKTLEGTMAWENNSGSYYGTFNHGGKHPAHTMYDITWWGDGNEIAKLEADGTFTTNALDLPKDFTIVDISEYGPYLAILANRGTYLATQESRVFFWDMASATWNFDRKISRIVTHLDNNKGILKAFSPFADFTIFYYTGSIFRNMIHRSGIDITFPSTDNDIFDSNGEATYFIGKIGASGSESGAIDVYEYGNNFIELPNVINKKIMVCKGENYTPASISTSYRDYILVAYNDGDNKLGAYYSGNQAGAWANTIDLDSYFGGIGRKKVINWIRVDFEPLENGDKMTLKFAKDYSRSFSNICKTAAGSAIDYSADGAVASKTFNSNLQIGNFRQLQLQFYFNSGEVRIHRVIIDWKYADTTAR